MSFKSFGTQLPQVDLSNLTGKLIVIEGPDCSGRSTHIKILKEWLESYGYAVLDTGLKRSNLIGSVIEEAKKGNTLGKTTLSLMYATDFADQLENKIVPALRSGCVVLADRYIYALIVRDIVRGADKDWIYELFSFALQPDLVFYLDVDSNTLLHRAFEKYGRLNYWESGMDLSLSDDIFESYKMYNELIRKEYEKVIKEFDFISVDGTQDFAKTQKFFMKKIKNFLDNTNIDESVY